MESYDSLVKALRSDAASQYTRDAAAAIEALQAEVAELKQVNMEIFEDLPKRGEWIVKGANRIDCSVCGHSVCFAFGLSEGSLDLYKYCPECGAKMEVQE